MKNNNLPREKKENQQKKGTVEMDRLRCEMIVRKLQTSLKKYFCVSKEIKEKFGNMSRESETGE